MKHSFLFILFIFSVFSFSQNGFVSPVCFNTSGDDFGIRLVNGKTYFITESIDSSGRFMKDYTSTRYFTDIYEVENCKVINALINSNDFGVKTSVNSDWYDGPMSYSEKDSIIFFSNTSEGFTHGKMGIYLSRKQKNDTYSTPIPFFYNSNKYSCLHPYYDNETGYLYFSSDMGTFLNFDIYRIRFIDNTFGELEELDLINTKNDELFPTTFNKSLFFTSNRENGMGGMDIYQSKDFANSILLDAPINSIDDDLALVYFSNSRGYFSSNRKKDSHNGDEIYEFYFPEKNKMQIIIPETNKALISDLEKLLKEFEQSDSPKAILIKSSLAELEKQRIQIENLSNKLNANTTLFFNLIDTTSSVSFEDKIKVYEQLLINFYTLESSSTLGNTLQLEEVLLNISNSNTREYTNDYLALSNILLNKKATTRFFEDTLIPFLEDNELINLKPIVERLNLGPEVVNKFLNNKFLITFYFDFDKSIIKEDERERVNFLANIINNSNGRIVLEGHTDSQGSSKYNEELAFQRVNEVHNYMIKNGIKKDKLVLIGRGEERPTHSNMTKEGRALNRRVEVSFLLDTTL